jgi:hypothetical protein
MKKPKAPVPNEQALKDRARDHFLAAADKAGYRTYTPPTVLVHRAKGYIEVLAAMTIPIVLVEEMEDSWH